MFLIWEHFTELFSLTITFLHFSAPAFFNGQNVLMTQENQRQSFDIMNTSISKPHMQQRNDNFMSQNFLPAQRIIVPGGAEFIFNYRPAIPQHKSYPTFPQRYVKKWMLCISLCHNFLENASVQGHLLPFKRILHITVYIRLIPIHPRNIQNIIIVCNLLTLSN